MRDGGRERKEREEGGERHVDSHSHKNEVFSPHAPHAPHCPPLSSVSVSGPSSGTGSNSSRHTLSLHVFNSLNSVEKQQQWTQCV